MPAPTSFEMDSSSDVPLVTGSIAVNREVSNDVPIEAAFLPLKLGMSHEEAVREVPLGAEFLLLTSSSQLSHARMARLPGGPEVTVVEDSAGVVIQIWSSDPTATIGNGVHPGLTYGELRQRYPSVEPMEYPGFGRIVELERNLRVKLHTSGEAVVDADTISSVVLYGRSY
jgi:hypothetical protein